MATKKNNYPSVKKSGIYPNGTDKELGLTDVNLEKFSLGNWNSIRKNSKLLVSNVSDENAIEEDPRGRPVQIQWDANMMFSNLSGITEAENYYDQRIGLTVGDANEFHSGPIRLGTRSFGSYYVKATRNSQFNKYSFSDVYKSDIFGTNRNVFWNAMEMGRGLPYTLSNSGFNNTPAEERQKQIYKYYANSDIESFNLTNEQTLLENLNNTLAKQINFDDGYAYIKERNDNNPSTPYIFEFDDALLAKMKDLVYIRDMNVYNGYGPGDYGADDKLYEGFGGTFFNRDDPNGINDFKPTHEIIFPRFFRVKVPDSPMDVILYLPTLPFGQASDSVKLPLPVELGNSNLPGISNQIFSEDNFLEFAFGGFFAPSVPAQIFNSFGAPLFKYNGVLSLPDTSLELNEVDFEVKCVTDNELKKDLLYYSGNDYLSTSYPLPITLDMNIFVSEDVDENIEANNVIRNLADDSLSIDPFSIISRAYDEESEYDFNIAISPNVTNAIYRYQVIQWGDEKTLLTDVQIENTYFFNFYNAEEYPQPNDWGILRYNQEILTNSKKFGVMDKHIYLTPGVKSIKIVVYRYNESNTYITETYLVTKNIVINDGLLSTRDFSIFGAGNFNIIPIQDNQAIIGGFDDESKYHNSVSKIVKDDNFIQDDYLERVSSRDYIKKINNGSLGNQPGQLDLGQTRVFTEPKDIYDFIGANKLEWINQGSGSLPVNSLATDIFIRDNKCVVDLNPSNTEYSAIQNQAGSEEIGILIGDYKINQSEGSSVQKQGVMETPLLETDNEKQAF